jgi:hypothetical protein
MPGIPGIDASVYPGGNVMAWLLANSNARWCGYYLAPAPSHADKSWMGKRAALSATGWGLAPLYVGQQLSGKRSSHIVSGPQGTADGQRAARLMTAEGFPAGSYVYLDLEDGPPLTAPRTDYLSNWAATISASGFQAGVYCSHDIAAAVHALCPMARIWAFNVSTVTPHIFPGVNFPDSAPAGCGYAGAYAWQLVQNSTISVGTAPPVSPEADLNSAVAPDPGAP